MIAVPGGGPAFPRDFDHVAATADGETAYFGRNVLRGLVEGIHREVQRQRSRSSDRHWGTGVLGCAMWMDDPELMEVLAKCQNVCVVVTKQPRTGTWAQKDAMMRRFQQETGADDGGGLAPEAYPELDEYAPPQEDGGPLVVGPYNPAWRGGISSIRELGFRKSGNRLVPIVHAKMALVGEMRWTDEHPSGQLVDDLYFVPRRLWLGSANFTAASRRSLEMGTWTVQPEMMRAARRFLLALIARSEPWGTRHDNMSPELLPIEYDDAAFFEYLSEIGPLVDEGTRPWPSPGDS